MQFFVIPTAIGAAKIAAAIADDEPLSITHMAIGDGGGSVPTPNPDQSGLANEVFRAELNLLTSDSEHPGQFIAEAIVPPSIGGWFVREVGLFDTDDDLIYVGNFPPTYKPATSENSRRDLVIRLHCAISDTDAVELIIDPSVAVASRTWVVSNFSHPGASANIGAEGGTLQEELDRRARTFRDIAHMKSAEYLKVGETVEWLEHTEGHGYEGGNNGLIVDSAGPAHIELDNGLWAKPLFPNGVNICHFGAVDDWDGATGTLCDDALHRAMVYLITQPRPERDAGVDNMWDYKTIRQTGRIHFPRGTWCFSNRAFSHLGVYESDPVVQSRRNFVGFLFTGDGKMSSRLMLLTGGSESWFFDNDDGEEKDNFQRVTFEHLGFVADNHNYGSIARVWSMGGTKQLRFHYCDFSRVKHLVWTEGSSNADLNGFVGCTGHLYGDILTLNNSQSVQHDFVDCSLGTFGSMVRLKKNGGGNVSWVGGFVDLISHTDFSPPTGTSIFAMDSDAYVGPNNKTFSFRDLRIEVEAYRRDSLDPTGMVLVNTPPAPNVGFPRVLLDNINFVNGATYTIDESGNIIGEDRRRIVAAKIYPRKWVKFANCDLLKNFFYEIGGLHTIGSPNSGGVIKIEDCFDGVPTDLPSGDAGLLNIHKRAAISGDIGRFITTGMGGDNGGNPRELRLADSDRGARRTTGTEEGAIARVKTIKPSFVNFPTPGDLATEITVDIPPELVILRLYIDKPAGGSSTSTYRLLFGNDDKSVVYSASAIGELKDRHTIDIKNLVLSGVDKVRIWAEGTATSAPTGGFAYIEHL